MKKQDIRNAYTQKVTELLNQGYTIFPDTMNGSQGEIAHIDLTNGSEIIRVLLERGLCWSHISDGFHGDVVTLTVGRAAADTWVGDRWDGTIWNSRLEPSFQIKWAEVNGRGEGWYSTALRWLRKQPKMKTCKLEDIEKMERVWNEDGKRRFEITAKGKRYTIR